VGRLQFHTLGQGHLVLYALFVFLQSSAARARGGEARVRGYVLRGGRGKREEVWTGVAPGQGGGRGRRVDGEARRAVVQRVLGEGAEVPGRGAVVRGDALAALQPGQGAVQ